MLTKILEALNLDQPDSLKRALAALLGGVAALAVPLVNSHLDAPLAPEQVTGAVTALAGILAAYLLQSGANAGLAKLAEAKLAGAQTAAGIATVEQANAVLKAAADTQATP
jgi:hypothetical protein